MSTNVSYLYYKKYFRDVDFSYITAGNGKSDAPVKLADDIKKRNKELQDSQLIHMPASLGNNTFQLKTEYPGLVTGIGINHEAGIKGEFKLGVHFDYTYGQPVIYGSSVKGVLRSAFKMDDHKFVLAYDCLKKFTPDDIKQLENLIFEGKGLSIYDRDIFYDAVIVRANKNGKIVASDSITPHPDELKNPIPITFLKIASGVTLEFRFRLNDTRIGDKILKASEKCDLFKQILLDLGAGAKTNVGYGQFAEVI